EIIVPNEVLTTQTVHNVTTGGRLRRATRLQVAYGCDPEQVIEVLLAAIRSNPHVLAEPGPTVRLVGFAAAGLEFEFAFHTSEPSPAAGSVASAVNRAVYAALLGAGLAIQPAWAGAAARIPPARGFPAFRLRFRTGIDAPAPSARNIP